MGKVVHKVQDEKQGSKAMGETTLKLIVPKERDGI
jgi:hypothetical protein